MVEFVALAIGPKHVDLEVKDFLFGKPRGRVQFDINVQQIQTMNLTLESL